MIVRRWLRLEAVALLVLAVGGVLAWASEPERGVDYAAIDEELEPFRSDFDAARDRVRAVLLVGPT